MTPVITTTTSTFGAIQTGWDAATSANGTGTRVVTDSLDEDASGTGASVSGTMDTLHKETYDQDVNWQFGAASGTAEVHTLDSTAHDVEEDPSDPAHPVLTDTATTTTEYHDKWTKEGPDLVGYLSAG